MEEEEEDKRVKEREREKKKKTFALGAVRVTLEDFFNVCFRSYPPTTYSTLRTFPVDDIY